MVQRSGSTFAGRMALPFAVLPFAIAVACGGEGSMAEWHGGGELGSETEALIDESLNEIDTRSGPMGSVILPDVLGRPRLYTYEEIDGEAVHEGDIVLGTLAELENLAKGVVVINKTWPDRTLVYQLHSSLTSDTAENTTTRQRITNAMAHWTDRTGIRFRLKTASDTAYVRFQRDDDRCYSSSMGRSGSRQTIGLRTSCTRGNVIHEIGHALGMEHEHSRCDRDTLINYISSRVVAGKTGNFTKKCSSNHQDVFTLDFDSIMMYGSTAFAKDPDLPPLTRQSDGGTWIGQRASLSDTDIRTIRWLYPKFTNPRVPTTVSPETPVQWVSGNIMDKHRFCIDQGYTGALIGANDTTAVVLGTTTVARYNFSTQRWDPVSGSTGINWRIYTSITCSL